MGCYRCNSDKGTDSILCPKCTQARFEEQQRYSMRESILSGFRWDWRLIRELLFEDSLIVLIFTCIVALGFLYFIGISAYGPGLFLTRNQYVTKQCRVQVAAVAKLRASGVTVLPATNPMAAGQLWDREVKRHYGPIIGSQMGRGLAVGLEGICDSIATECATEKGKKLCIALYESTRWGAKG